MPRHRIIWLPVLLSVLLLLISLGLLVNNAWRNSQRLQPLNLHLRQITQLQAIALQLQASVDKYLQQQNGAFTSERYQQLLAELSSTIIYHAHLHQTTPVRLRRAHSLLSHLHGQQRDVFLLIGALSLLQQVLESEMQAHEALLTDINLASRRELLLASGLMLALPLLALLILWLLRKRIVRPLRQLSALMSLLAERDYQPAPPYVDPLLQPLFGNYNHLVQRLRALEQANQQRQQSLEAEVRDATHALLLQQRQLARSERLAAVGELAAGVAHELRNPLAGIHIACANLQREVDNPEHQERLGLVLTELQRLTRLLNNLLKQAKQPPEPAQAIALAEHIQALLSLVRYQIPNHISLHSDMSSDLICHLPADRLHQAILNLVLNAARAIPEEVAGEIWLRAVVEEEMLVLSVSDNGTGFPAALLEKGIQPFVSWQQDGTGLGLVMVQRFVREVGGTLVLQNASDGGAEVLMRLPLGGVQTLV